MYNHREGVSLRKIEKTDLKDLLFLKQESWWGTNQTPILNSEDQEKWFQSLNEHNLAMIGEIDPKLQSIKPYVYKQAIGFVLYSNINWLHRSLLLSGSIYDEYRQPGTIRSFYCAGLDFAFEILNMNRVEAFVLETNIPAQKIEIDLLGGTIEGRRRQSVYKSGKYYDTLIVGLLREEWEKSCRVIGYNDSCNTNFSHRLAEQMMGSST